MDAYLAELGNKLGAGETLRVGFLENATYPDGTSVALVAAIQNFGAPARGIPPRPFFTNMVADKSDGWGPALGRILEANGDDVPAALALMGEGIAGQLREAITTFQGEPLSPATVASKGFDKALVDTGVMLQSVAYEVSDGPLGDATP